jgi:hypothetical protein
MADTTGQAVIEIVPWDRVVPPASALTEKQRTLGDRPLPWVRMETTWPRDPDVLDQPPSERVVWPALLALAGRDTPHGTIRMNSRQLARELDLPQRSIEHAVSHLAQRGKVRVSGAFVAAATKSRGASVTLVTERGGHVRTHGSTDDDARTDGSSRDMGNGSSSSWTPVGRKGGPLERVLGETSVTVPASA